MGDEVIEIELDEQKIDKVNKNISFFSKITVLYLFLNNVAAYFFVMYVSPWNFPSFWNIISQNKCQDFFSYFIPVIVSYFFYFILSFVVAFLLNPGHIFKKERLHMLTVGMVSTSQFFMILGLFFISSNRKYEKLCTTDDEKLNTITIGYIYLSVSLILWVITLITYGCGYVESCFKKETDI